MRTESDRVAVLQLGPGDSLLELATYDRADGVRRGGHSVVPALARSVLARAREGPWVEEVSPDEPGTRRSSIDGSRAIARGGRPSTPATTSSGS